MVHGHLYPWTPLPVITNASLLTSAGVELMGLDSCPAENLTTKFPLADVESWSGAAPGSFTGALPQKLNPDLNPDPDP